MQTDLPLTPQQFDKIKTLQARILAEPDKPNHTLDLVDALFRMQKLRPGLKLLDRFEKTNMCPESYALRIELCNYLLQLADPKDAPEEFKDYMQYQFELLKDALPDAMYFDANKAYILFDGLISSQLHDMALYFLEKAADLSHAGAQAALGRYYAMGKHFAYNPRKAYEWTLKAAVQNHPEGLNNLGTLHLEGIGTPVNYEKAYKYLMKAYQAGDTTSLSELGLLLYEGKGIQADPEQARQIWLVGKQKDEQGCAYYLDTYFPPGASH